jgi:hypothetical protein
MHFIYFTIILPRQQFTAHCLWGNSDSLMNTTLLATKHSTTLLLTNFTASFQRASKFRTTSLLIYHWFSPPPISFLAEPVYLTHAALLHGYRRALPLGFEETRTAQSVTRLRKWRQFIRAGHYAISFYWLLVINKISVSLLLYCFSLLW